MQAQEVFDKVVTHLFTQRRRSANEQMCLYRDVEGNSCAVGCLIPDEEYQDYLEGQGVCSLYRSMKKYPTRYPITLSILDGHVALLGHLQSAHDDAEVTVKGTFNINSLRKTLIQVAKEFNLKYDRSKEKPVKRD